MDRLYSKKRFSLLSLTGFYLWLPVSEGRENGINSTL
jgi:hypothetical protein